MSPDSEEGRPGGTTGNGLQSDHQGGGIGVSTVADRSDERDVVRLGWIRAGDCLPRRGSVALRLLADDDPVKAAAEVADDNVRRHGPHWAELIAGVAE